MSSPQISLKDFFTSKQTHVFFFPWPSGISKAAGSSSLRSGAAEAVNAARLRRCTSSMRCWTLRRFSWEVMVFFGLATGKPNKNRVGFRWWNKLFHWFWNIVVLNDRKNMGMFYCVPSFCTENCKELLNDGEVFYHVGPKDAIKTCPLYLLLFVWFPSQKFCFMVHHIARYCKQSIS